MSVDGIDDKVGASWTVIRRLDSKLHHWCCVDFGGSSEGVLGTTEQKLGEAGQF